MSSATYASNVTITGNLNVQGTIFANLISAIGNVSTTFGSVSLPTGLGPGPVANHTAILLNDGTVRVCGRNNNGQLGQNDLNTRSTVVSVLGISSQAIAVACGFNHTAILMNDGTVRVCGYNTFGQLGQNDTADRSTVVSVLGISSQAIAVACGQYHTAILLNNGTVRVCGVNAYGQLGLNDTANRLTVVPVLGISSQAIAVASGQYHIAILMNDGTVRVCGRNASGQLGQNDTADRSTVVPVLGISSQAIAVACGTSHAAILLNNGTVRICGLNTSGQLGQNDTANRLTVVSVLGISSQAIAVTCGGTDTAILLNDGTVRVCGANTQGQLGQNNTADRSTVVSVLGISSQAIAVACGQFHTAILLNDGTVRVCGRNQFGQLGQNDLNNRSTVVTVPYLSNQVPTVSLQKQNTVNFIGPGPRSYLAAMVMNDGTVRVCGANSSGQLGQNDLNTRSTVVSVLGISSQAIAVACGQFHTAILLNNGTVRICGANGNGQLGLNDSTTRSTVVPVLGISSQAIAVACGQSHTAILLNDGTVRVCGRNASGQLGQNDTVFRSTVVPVLGISSQAIAVASGQYHIAILMNDGTVRVCGQNTNGQLGQNDVVNRSTVVSVLGISSQAIAVACGSSHTAILLNDGTLRVCGLNSTGQLGINNITQQQTIVPVLKISSQAIAVACGGFYTAILLNDGTVRVCGRNQFGQLGLNDLNTRSTVVPVLGTSSQAIAIACGFYSISILMSDGTVRVCGQNSSGQLGQNDLNTRSTVVSVVLGMPTSAILIAPALNLGPVTNPIFQLELSGDGARKLTTSTWTTGSDEALKTDIQLADLDRCVDIVSQLDLKYFEWTVPSKDTHSLGWIAQDVEKFFPKSVVTAEAHGIPDFKNLNTDQIIKVMWGALKKLRADLKNASS